MRTYKVIVTVCAAVAAFFACSPVDHAGTATQTGNPTVAGTLYESDGTTPAAGVRVVIRPRNSLADTSGIGLPKSMADTATVTTDENGRFAFDSTIDAGTYVIEATSGNDAVLIDSVTVGESGTDTLPPDTLKPAGAITGVIRLSEGGDPRKVFVLAFGIDRFARVEEDGSFRFLNLAEGRYDLRIIASLDDYGVLDTAGVPVAAGDTTDMGAVELPFEGIPVVKGLKIEYDTMKQIVTLTWDKADTGLVKSYNIYRSNVDSNTVAVRVNASPVVDTVYRDSTGVQGQAYTYQVKALDKTNNEGEYSAAVTTTISMPFELTATWGGQGVGDGQFSEISDITVLPNNRFMAIDYGVHKVQILDSAGSFVRSWGQEGSADGDFTYPVAGAVDDSGYLYVLEMLGTGRVQKFDTAGTFIQSWTIGQYCRGLTYSRGNLFISSTNPAAIRIVDVSNGIQNTIPLAGSDLASIAADTAGSLFVSDQSQSHVFKTDTSGTIADSWGSSGSADGQFISPGDIALAENGNVFVADPNNGRIQVFSGTGEFLTKLVVAQIPAGSTEASVEKRPRAIAFNSDGNMLVADSYFIYRYAVLLK